MCELFAMSSRVPTTVGFSLERLARRGGGEGPHRDGWGVAFYEGRDAFILREPRAASESNLVRFIEQHPPPSSLVVSHIRLATHGDRALRNTQPFSRELGGRTHVLAHNGKLGGIERQWDLVHDRFLPIGDTDSELIFCGLLERLAPLWAGALDRVPPLAARLEVIAAFAAELRRFGPANFLYSDADALFVHAHRRQQPDGVEAPPGLHMLARSCSEVSHGLTGAGVTLTPIQQTLVLVASVPLTDEAWWPLEEGEVVAMAEGCVLERRPPTL
ncbi:MAG: class II glutamine amidotransferase [Pseudomonadota bacterium]|nr:class II glutamine amidotransferase [Pseudomonadota bacterium]